MIYRKCRGEGYGREAPIKALGEIRAILRVNKISIRYMPDNPVAKPLCATFGFVEVGRDCHGETIAVLKLECKTVRSISLSLSLSLFSAQSTPPPRLVCGSAMCDLARR
jgi:RimJ/RimL family protein N-acetyltransferase